MDLIEALRGTGAARSFTDEGIDDATLAAILDDARFAPSGGNRQPWRVAVVKDGAIRHGMAQLMRPVWNAYVGAGTTSGSSAPYAFGLDSDTAPVAAPNHLLDHIDNVPVVLAVAADLNRIALMDGNLDRPAMTGGASVYPFCWSILLAARARGLGGVMTTFLSRAEPAAVPLLGLPADHALCATIFLGRPQHQTTKLKRNPVQSFATVDRFDGDVFGD
ncbi:MAG: dehydrogenase [Ilumatobacteraceae bacterium]|nr:dehydrogenase [Ilumatobacteraceae bacterium]